MTAAAELKARVHDHWNRASCGEAHAITGKGELDLATQARERYALEPYILEFAKFHHGAGKDVLEIGVGMGADHALWARCRPRRLCGIDLTPRAVELTRRRLTDAKLRSSLHQADAERLPFDDESFDLVYSWGVLHHSPDTARCIGEVARVLRPGGVARIMVYHRWSLVGFMLWGRYALLRGQLRRSLDEVYFHHMESPGTKAYSRAQARQLFAAAGFAAVDVRVQLSHGDLLQGRVGARHRGMLLGFAKALWPRPLVRRLAPRLGLYLLIEARK
jgi:ubiquinone/menaquinone biosynthesis C-methylase UbiE